MQGNRKSGYLVTAVERKSGFLMAGYSATGSSAEVATVITHLFSRVPASFFKSIAHDQSKKFFTCQQKDKRLGTVSQVCHAACPGERGLNEQTNGLLRQFFPRSRNVKGLKNEETARAVAFINNRSRKTFDYKTTVEKNEGRRAVLRVNVRLTICLPQRRNREAVKRVWGGGEGEGEPFARQRATERRPAWPCPLRRRKLRASTAEQGVPLPTEYHKTTC